MNQYLTPAEKIALDTFLHEYPSHFDFNMVLSYLAIEELITIAEPFEDMGIDDLHDIILGLENDIQIAMNNIAQETLRKLTQIK